MDVNFLGDYRLEKNNHKIFFLAAIMFGGLFYVQIPYPALAQNQAAQIDARVQAAICGNGAREGAEQCDGLDLGGKTCRSIGFSGGLLLCSSACEVDTTSCVITASGGGGSPSSSINSLPQESKTPLSAASSKKEGATLKGDLNGDGKVDLIDFSIAAYWYKRPFLPESKNSDINGDGKVDLIDFSIMAYYWTR